MTDETRRSFLDTAIKGGILIGACGMAIPAGGYLWPAKSRGPKESVVSAGTADDFRPGAARMINSEGRPVLVLCVKEGEFRAFSAICTHLGCVVRWDEGEGRIACPCHAGFFAADGSVIGGPPPRPLPAYEVFVSGGEVRVRI